MKSESQDAFLYNRVLGSYCISLVAIILSFVPAVPLLPTGLVANVTGTASVQLVWDSPSVERLLGDIRLYYIFLENGMEETLYTNLTLTNSPSLTRGTVNVVQVGVYACMSLCAVHRSGSHLSAQR